MRNVNAHILQDKIDEAVTHYINTHPQAEPVHVDANGLPISVQDDTVGRVVTVMHPHAFPPQLCRPVSVSDQVGENQSWGEELMDPEMRLATIVAHLAQQNTRASHHQPAHHKVLSVRTDVDSSVMLDAPMRLFNGQGLDQQADQIVMDVPSLPPLPPLQEMKRCPETDWFSNKTKASLKDPDTSILQESESSVLELGASASPAHNKQQSKKSLPHKKRISKKLKRNTGNSTPQQQDLVVLNCNEEVQQEEILPDNFVTSVPHQEHLPEETHHITHEVRPIFICQICGDFYGDEQLKFYHHLKQHYEPHATIIIENAVADLGIDKMTNTCLVDNVATLPDSIVELSLENTVPKTMYQPIDKHIMYSVNDKTLSYSNNKFQYSITNIDKEPNVPTSEADKVLYESFEKLDYYMCGKCDKSFRKQKQCEVHIKEAHYKLEDMGEFSEPEDLMEGIHVAVDEGDQYDQSVLPHLTVDNGHVHQEHMRHWYMRNSGTVCNEDGTYCPATREQPNEQSTSPPQFKEEALQRIFEQDVVTTENATFTENIITNSNEIHTENTPEPTPETNPEAVPETNTETNTDPAEEETKNKKKKKKKSKNLECPHCARVFKHRNSLLYHILVHSEKQQTCRECGKSFYTVGALKVHKRVHNGDRPYKCEDCGRDFRQWSDLKYHKISKHSDQKLWKCEFCDKEFARKYSLNVHRRIHTGERNYKCHYCTKTFRASSYRLSHMRTHTGVKPYKCVECEKSFRVPGDLRRHMLTHEKVRNRFEQKVIVVKEEVKPKTPGEEKSKSNKTEIESPKTVKKVAMASTAKPTYKADKKQQKPAKKSQTKKGNPNVTVQNGLEGQFKLNSEYTNVEVFDTRQMNGVFNKFKEVYSITEYNKDTNQFDKTKDGFNEILNDYKEREFATLKPILGKSNQVCDNIESDKTFRSENMDGKMAVFTHVEKNGPTQVLGHLDREVQREVRSDSLQGEVIENSFFDRLTALYNIPAV